MEEKLTVILVSGDKEAALNMAFMYGASIGIAQYPDDGGSFEELYNKADKAMYLAKQNGKGKCAVYEAPGAETSENKGIEAETPPA